MHNNYYFLRQLVPQLKERFCSFELLSCFSQVKDELIIGFGRDNDERFIRAYLQSDFSCLSFPATFARANKNTADLFPELIGKQVQDVVLFDNERSFAIRFDQGYDLLFKLYGNRSNLVLFEHEVVNKLFKQRLIGDKNLEWRHLDRHIPQDYSDFVTHQGNLQKIFPTFGTTVKAYLDRRDYASMPIEMQWKEIMQLKELLENPKGFYLTHLEGVPALSLVEVGEVSMAIDDPMEALNALFVAYTRDYLFEKEKLALVKLLEGQIKSAQAYLEKTRQKLQEIQQATSFDKTANIIMANLHQIPPKADEVQLFDFYQDKRVTIKLNSKLSPQKYAETLYRKAKNQQIEIENIQQNISSKEKQQQTILQHLAAVEEIMAFRQLRKYSKEHGLTSSSKQEESASPFKVFEADGFQILIGKNARNNDLLTQSAYKEDLWLHAKDVSGSHVIVKFQSGKQFPKPVIERAAQLAAYYSQRKTDSLCPVIYTPKKFVRKPKGAFPGAVVVEKEKVILVKPEK